MLANSSLFLVNVYFFNLHSLISAKLCFAESTTKIVFSEEHSLCVSQIVKPPFEAPSQNGTFATKNAIFCNVWWFCMVTENDISKNK